MLKKITEFFEGLPMTCLSGAFLVLSLLFGEKLPIDPAWATVVISGLPLICGAVKKLVCEKGIGKISSSLLIVIAMTAAVAVDDLFAAGEVAFIMAIGELLEDFTTDRAKKGLRELIELTPVTARRLTDIGEETIPAEEVRCGDIIRILPGEKIAVDGIIVNGETTVDQSVMTGESLPVDKAVGDDVYCGTLNCFGAIDIKASRVGADSSLSRLIEMVKQAEDKKAPMARTADKAASFLVPAALLIAVITGFLTSDITRAVTVLVVFCPCALVLATPTAIMAAVGQAAKKGVIIKSGEALEKMSTVDTVAFDKTGTLTHGTLEVSDIVPFGNREKEKILSTAACCEAKSEHPLGKAIVAFAKKNGIETDECEDFKMSAGRGVCGVCFGKKVFCGNEKYLSDNEVTLGDAEREKTEELRRSGKALVIVAEGETAVGVIALSDKLRTSAVQTVSELKNMGVESVLLTGDSRLAAEYFADKVGIENVRAELMPEHKVDGVSELKSQGKAVCMVGDGVNDAPALKTADIGVAMGKMGSDIAVEAADIALMGDDVSRLPYLKRLSVATVRTIKFSITLSMVINIIGVILSVAGLLTPTTGALVHNIGSCFVVLIAALLYDRKF